MPQNYNKVDCSNFVADTVLPNLVNTEEVALGNLDAISKLRRWVEGFEEQVVFCCDAPNFDWVLLSNFFEAMGEKLPRNLRPHPKNVFSDAVSASMDGYFDSNMEAIRHNALWDARALAYACKA